MVALLALIGEAEDLADRKVRKMARKLEGLAPVIYSARKQAEKKRHREGSARPPHQLEVKAQPAPGTAPTCRWPCKLKRSLALAGDPAARQKAEQAERRRWLNCLADLVVEAKLPVAQLALALEWPEGVLMKLGQGRRARTIRQRVREWDKARRYFLTMYDLPWPSSEAHLLEYLQGLEGSGAPPYRFVYALVWVHSRSLRGPEA